MAHTHPFDPKQAFFILDSLCLDQVQTQFYGFTLLDDRMIRSAVDLAGRMPTGDGAYIYIRRDGSTVTIHQDFMGSYGLYLFRKDGYFALSNSFMRLAEYVADRYPITLNREYADFFLTADLCSVAYGETLVSEIQCLDRAAVVEISIPDKVLTTHLHDYGENTVELSSPEGMKLLDAWFHKWAGLIRSLKAQTNNIQTDLSGGFDSRLTFDLLLGSGVDLSDIFVFSIHDDLHTHAEDYEIAESMADRYGFRLNDSSKLTPGIPLETPREPLDLSLYTKLGFHKQIYNQSRYYETPRYNFVGNGGECVRDYWNMSREEYIETAVSRCRTYPGSLPTRLEASIRSILARSFQGIQEKFSSLGRPLAEGELTLNLYRETRCRNHFGKAIVERLLANSITCAPLLDPLLHRLKRSDSTCSDHDLLIAVIYSRFVPDLLDFKFDNGRKIEESTVAYARELNARFPFVSRLSGERIPTPAERVPNPQSAIPAETVTDIILDIFRSQEIRGSFAHLYGSDTYDMLLKDISSRKFYPLQSAYTTIAISMIRRMTQSSQAQPGLTLGDRLCRHCEAARLSPPAEDTLWNHPLLENWITARVDLKLAGADVEILSVSDGRARVYTPSFMLSNGTGWVVESQKGSMTVRFRCCAAGDLNIAIRGRAASDREGNRIPYWVDYTRICLDGGERIRGRRPICHDVPLKMDIAVTDGQELELTVEWLPHDERRNRLLERILPPEPRPSLLRRVLRKLRSF